jgi:mRNA interferase RelE/StbE
VSYQVNWEIQALDQTAGFLRDDPVGVAALWDTVGQLADEPRPPESFPYGSPDLRRLRAGRYRVFYTIDEEQRIGPDRPRRPPAVALTYQSQSAVTFCSWHPVIAMVRRGPVRGPSHPCKRCNQGHQRRGSVVSVQVVRTMHKAVLLIIRRSWVRAPPAPPTERIASVKCRWPAEMQDSEALSSSGRAHRLAETTSL